MKFIFKIDSYLEKIVELNFMSDSTGVVKLVI